MADRGHRQRPLGRRLAADIAEVRVVAARLGEHHGRSNAGPSFFTSAGARLIVTFGPGQRDTRSSASPPAPG